MTDYHRLPIRHPARHDFGARIGPTRALVYHMAEGTNVAIYLSTGNVLRNVSVHYTIEQQTSAFADGEIVRILPEGRISGSINPQTIRRDEDPDLYGASHAKHALGEWWLNPNQAVITVEVAGRALEGPTQAQVLSMVRLFEDVDRRYGRVIPLGHRDFQNVKPCPGKTAAMRRAFDLMGGHGRDFDGIPGRRYMSTRRFQPGLVCDVPAGTNVFNYPGGKPAGKVGSDGSRAFLGYVPNGQDHALVHVPELGPGRTAWVKAGRVSNVREGSSDTPDGSKAAGWEAMGNRVIADVTRALNEGPP